jgi:hypothetical protein
MEDPPSRENGKPQHRSVLAITALWFAYRSRNGEWLLKNSTFIPNSQNLGDTKYLENRESRLWGILTQSFFDHFSANEFFNSKGPGRWSGQSGKELVLAAPFLHPDMERQATEVGRSGSGGL